MVGEKLLIRAQPLTTVVGKVSIWVVFLAAQFPLQLDRQIDFQNIPFHEPIHLQSSRIHNSLFPREFIESSRKPRISKNI